MSGSLDRRLGLKYGWINKSTTEPVLIDLVVITDDDDDDEGQ